jgi:hypothetical protein
VGYLEGACTVGRAVGKCDGHVVGKFEGEEGSIVGMIDGKLVVGITDG